MIDEQKKAYSEFINLLPIEQLSLLNDYKKIYKSDKIYRTAKLRFDDRFSFDDIANRMDIHRATVYKRLRKFAYMILKLNRS